MPRILLYLLTVGMALGLIGCAPHEQSRQASFPAGPFSVPSVPSTFSIAACDPDTGDLGVAVASRFLAVGSVVPWVEAGVGAIATQSYANTSFGPRGLKLLRDGWTPEDAAKWLLEHDPEAEYRQLGVVDAGGRSHAFTGTSCKPWAGSRPGEGFTVQGNLLVSEQTLEAMETAYLKATGELALRLLAALEAAQAAGGDARGRQSAALVVARKQGGYGGFNDRYVDLRVDDHPRPIRELKRLLLLRLGGDPISQSRRLERDGQEEKAIDTLEEAVRRHPAWVDARFELARLLLEAGEDARAAEELDRAIAANPVDPHHHVRAARLLARSDQDAAAIEHVDRALALNREYAAVFRRELEAPTSPLRPLKERIEPLLEKAEN